MIEEAITSNQLEGAATSRNVAKETLTSGRSPRTRDERMIVNNFRAMQQVREWRELEITPARVCEPHRLVTEDTLDRPHTAACSSAVNILVRLQPAEWYPAPDLADQLHAPED